MYNIASKTLLLMAAFSAVLTSCRTQKQATQTAIQDMHLETAIQDTSVMSTHEQRHTTLTVTFIPLAQSADTLSPMQPTPAPTTIHQPTASQTATELARILTENGGGTLIIEEKQIQINQEQTQTHTLTRTDEEQEEHSTMTLRDYRRTPQAISFYVIFGLFAVAIILEIIKINFKL